MTNPTLVSAIVTTHNQDKYLNEALESIANQTYGANNIELTIVNDASVDNTKGVIEKFIDKHRKTFSAINYATTGDMGASKCRDNFITTCLGKYYFVLDGDDIVDPKFLEKTVPLLDNNTNDSIGFVYVDTKYFYEDGNSRIVPSPEYSLFRLLQSNFMSYCSLFRVDAYLDTRGYDLQNFGYWEDYQLYIEYANRGYYGLHLQEPLFYYRVHSDSSFQSERAKKFAPLYMSYIITKFPSFYPQEWINDAKKSLKKYPKNFMALKPHEQAEYLKENK